jgi:rhodanese-related sulfurtransferase
MHATRSFVSLVLFCGLVALAGCGGDEPSSHAAAAQEVDGRIEGGLRVLTLDPATPGRTYRVYRGDYIRPERADGQPFSLEIPALDVSRSFPAAEGDKPHVAVPDAGRYEFRSGELTGVIEALDYRAAAYREVNSRQAAAFIENLQPLVLDVRTPREFAGGHLEGAQLVPVQVFRQRLPELMPHRDRPVFIYCRTGNRSTVAAKMLVDAGFTNVVNLRRGIVEWQREGLPTVR